MLRNHSVALSQNPCMVYVVVTGIIPRLICNLISVVVIALRLSYVAQIIFCAAGTNIGRARLLRTCFRIRLQVVIRIVSDTYFICVGENLWGVPLCGSWNGTRVVIWYIMSDVIWGELSLSGSCWPLSKIGVSHSESHALAHRSSSFMMTSGSGFRSFDVAFTSGMGCLGVNKQSLMRWRTWVLFVPSFRTK